MESHDACGHKDRQNVFLVPFRFQFALVLGQSFPHNPRLPGVFLHKLFSPSPGEGVGLEATLTYLKMIATLIILRHVFK